MNPYLEPGFAFQVNIAKRISDFVPIEGALRFVQCRSASAEQKAADVWRTHGVGNQARNLVGDELNRIFVVHAPIDPLLIIDVGEQMQNGSLNIRGRREIFDSFAFDAAKLLIGDMKDKRMIRPQSFVLNDQMFRDRSIPIAGENDRLYLIRRTHSQTVRCPL